MHLSPVSLFSSWFSPIINATAFVSLREDLASLFFQKIKGNSLEQQNALGKQKAVEFEWVISDDLGKKANVDLSLITKTLDAAGIPYTLTPATEWPPKNRIPLPQTPDRPIDLFSVPQEIVWKNDHVQIVIAKEQGRFHLLVKPTKESPLAELSAKDYVHLKRTIAYIPELFEKVFGSPAFCEALVESKTTFGFEIFPGATKKSGEVDLLSKDKRALYFLSQGRWTSYSLPPDQIDALKKEIPIVFSKPLQRQELPYPNKREETNLAESRKFRVHTLLKMLSNEGYPVMAVKPFVKTRSVKKVGNGARSFETKNRCFFCPIKSEEVIFKADKTLLAATIYPFVQNKDEGKHVLIAPVRHITDCVGLTDQEIQEERDILLRLRKIWNTIYPNEEFFSWRQQGVEVGQTVGHLHTQALTTAPRQLREYYVATIKDFMGPPTPVFSANAQLTQGMINWPGRI